MANNSDLSDDNEAAYFQKRSSIEPQMNSSMPLRSKHQLDHHISGSKRSRSLARGGADIMAGNWAMTGQNNLGGFNLPPLPPMLLNNMH